jgi:hypothetical protein
MFAPLRGANGIGPNEHLAHGRHANNLAQCRAHQLATTRCGTRAEPGRRLFTERRQVALAASSGHLFEEIIISLS